MKQTTKVLLPLGLFMSIVIPVTVKALFTDSDLFQSDESSKIDYLQPYKIRPENSLDMPNTGIVPIEQEIISQDREKPYRNISRKDNKMSTPNTSLPSDAEMQLQLELQNEIDARNIAKSSETFK